MVLSAQEESLISIVRPPDEAFKILEWARHLADLGAGHPVAWSDAWTDEDCADATRSALRRFESLERGRILKPGDVVVGAFAQAQMMKVRPAVVLNTART